MAAKKVAAKKKLATGKHRKEPEPFAERLGSVVRAVREAKEISFDAVVGTSELGRGYVSELERGLAVPSVTTLNRLAEALDTTAVDLLAEVVTLPAERRELIVASGKLKKEDLKRLVDLARSMVPKKEG